MTASYVGSAAPTGWLILNGDTLGSAASTATQKSDDYQTLYELLWNSMADAEAPVDGGRGLTATADFTANKKLTMPDARGRVIAGKEVSQSLLTVAISGLDSSTLGKTGGDQRAQDHTHTVGGTSTSVNDVDQDNSNSPEHFMRIPTNAVTGNPNGSKHGGDSANVQPTIVLNWIIKT